MSLFSILVKLKARKCVVIGAGRIAAAKAEGLLRHGARVQVIAPQAVKAIRDHARAGKLIWLQRTFSGNDVEGAFLVVAATNSNSTNDAVFRACRSRGVLCNVVDDPERCDFFYPAVVRRGPLQIAISTSGRSPALARRLRMELEKQFGPEFGDWVERLGKTRKSILRQPMAGKKRRELIEEISSSKSFEQFLQNRNLPRKQKTENKALRRPSR